MARVPIEMYVLCKSNLQEGRTIMILVTLEEMEDILDGFTIDQIQEFIIDNIICGQLLMNLNPYITRRLRKNLDC